MNWFQLFAAILPIAEEVLKAISEQTAAGVHPSNVHVTITDHLAQLPGVIRAGER